ncbi:MAG: GAF domain-containing protein [Armatimonadetes bacterium]|nr:GAF domain-containing protein [Armatimonadota bacterium]
MERDLIQDPPISVTEALRILDGLPDWHYDCVTAIAAHLFKTPIAAISYVGRTKVWFRSKSGLEIDELPREVTFCSYTVNQADPFVIEDATQDERFKDSPLVTGELGLRFYAGCSIVVDGETVGALCVTDQQPQTFSTDDRAAIALLANLASALMQSEMRIKELSDEVVELRNGTESAA